MLENLKLGSSYDFFLFTFNHKQMSKITRPHFFFIYKLLKFRFQREIVKTIKFGFSQLFRKSINDRLYGTTKSKTILENIWESE